MLYDNRVYLTGQVLEKPRFVKNNFGDKYVRFRIYVQNLNAKRSLWRNNVITCVSYGRVALYSKVVLDKGSFINIYGSLCSPNIKKGEKQYYTLCVLVRSFDSISVSPEILKESEKNFDLIRDKDKLKRKIKKAKSKLFKKKPKHKTVVVPELVNIDEEGDKNGGDE